ncbi:uncharacterized protein LOC114502298 [Phyllostomus discolor]|uniref:Uncharacterized protein LOC114502298 n=1 Tax=Phyllostomus discolor TaxID=89673 RepID=A0A7E6CDA9_9CHIR|nr:uncharacterized protein LOC114502298 [Phyllostomus discolor]
MWLPPALLLLCLPGCLSLGGPSVVRGTVGSSLTVRCWYEEGYKGYNKYWCRGEHDTDCNKIVETDGEERERRNGRVSIQDNAHARTLTVTMRNLHAADAGSYWCKIQTVWILDVWSRDPSFRVQVSVSPGKSPLTPAACALTAPGDQGGATPKSVSGSSLVVLRLGGGGKRLYHVGREGRGRTLPPGQGRGQQALRNPALSQASPAGSQEAPCTTVPSNGPHLFQEGGFLGGAAVCRPQDRGDAGGVGFSRLEVENSPANLGKPVTLPVIYLLQYCWGSHPKFMSPRNPAASSVRLRAPLPCFGLPRKVEEALLPRPVEPRPFLLKCAMLPEATTGRNFSADRLPSSCPGVPLSTVYFLLLLLLKVPLLLSTLGALVFVNRRLAGPGRRRGRPDLGDPPRPAPAPGNAYPGIQSFRLNERALQALHSRARRQ